MLLLKKKKKDTKDQKTNKHKNVFVEKHHLIAWAYKLTKSTAALLHFVFVFDLSHPLCSYFAITLDSRKNRTNNKFVTRYENYPN
jgi:hypothetical protein